MSHFVVPPPDTYDFTPFLTAPAITSRTRASGSALLDIVRIPETPIVSPLAANLAPATVFELKTYLCGKDELEGQQDQNGERRDDWRKGLKKRIGEEPEWEKKNGKGKSVDAWGEKRATEQGREIWCSWKRAWDLWNNHYIPGRVNALWVKARYDELKQERENQKTKRILERSQFRHVIPPNIPASTGEITNTRPLLATPRIRPNQSGARLGDNLIVFPPPAGPPAIASQPSGVNINPTYRHCYSNIQPKDAMPSRIWRKSTTHPTASFWRRTKQIISSSQEQEIEIATTVAGQRRKRDQPTVEKKAGEQAIIWRETPRYHVVKEERLIWVATGRVVVNWTDDPFDLEALDPVKFKPVSGTALEQRTKYIPVMSRTQLGPGRSAMYHQTELWDTGEKRTLEQDENVPGQEVESDDEIQALTRGMGRHQIVVLEVVQLPMWEEVDASTGLSLPPPPPTSFTMTNSHTLSPSGGAGKNSDNQSSGSTQGFTSQNIVSPQAYSAGGALAKPTANDTDKTGTTERGKPIVETSTESATLTDTSGGFVSMKELPEYKALTLARERYDAGDDTLTDAELTDIVSNTVWRPRRVGEKKLKIDMDEDIDDFFTNSDLDIDGGVDCGRSPYPVLRNVVHYFQQRRDGLYYKKKVWDQVRGTLFNMPTHPDDPEPVTEQQKRAKAVSAVSLRQEDETSHTTRHDLFPIDIRRCDRVVLLDNRFLPKPRPENDVTERVEYPWDNQASMSYENLPTTDPWWVTPEVEGLRDVPPRRYPPRQPQHNSTELLHVDDTLWRDEIDRDEHNDSMYFATNLHGGKLVINGQEVTKGQVAGPLPSFAVIVSEGGQVSFWWGTGGREWCAGLDPDESGSDYKSQWESVRKLPGWKYCGLNAGEVWDMIIRDRLEREGTGENQADDEQWDEWKLAKANLTSGLKDTETYNQKLELTTWDGEGNMPQKLYEVAQPACFNSEEEELQWLITRAQPLKKHAETTLKSDNWNIIVPDPSEVWDGPNAIEQPPEIKAQSDAEKVWEAFKPRLLGEQRALTQKLEKYMQQRNTQSSKARTEATIANNKKRKALSYNDHPEPKRSKEELSKSTKEAAPADDQAETDSSEDRRMKEAHDAIQKRREEYAVRALQKKKHEDDAALAKLLATTKSKASKPEKSQKPKQPRLELESTYRDGENPVARKADRRKDTSSKKQDAVAVTAKQHETAATSAATSAATTTPKAAQGQATSRPRRDVIAELKAEFPEEDTKTHAWRLKYFARLKEVKAEEREAQLAAKDE